MILVYTSIWIDHLRGTTKELTARLEAGQVAVHPWVIGELACGKLQNLQAVLTLLSALPTVVTAHHQEVLTMISEHQLMGRGIGYVDAHLISSALMSHAVLWTNDKRLARNAIDLGMAY